MGLSHLSESHSVMSDSLWLYSPWNSPGQNTGVGSLSLLQGIFPTQGSNPGFPFCRWILYQLYHLPANAGDVRGGSVPGSGRSPGGGNDNPLQYSLLENPMDKGAWRVIVQRVTKCWTWLSTHTRVKDNITFLEKFRRNSLVSSIRQRVLRLDTKNTIDRLDCIKIKLLFYRRDSVKVMKRQAQSGENI